MEDYAEHKRKLEKYTGNVSRRKAFLKREGLRCFGACVRGVVDGFATAAEIAALRELSPPEPGASGSSIAVWLWETPPEQPLFATRVVFDGDLTVEDHRRPRIEIKLWPVGNGAMVRVAGPRECDETVRHLPRQPPRIRAATGTRSSRIDIVEHQRDIQRVERPQYPARFGTGKVELIHPGRGIDARALLRLDQMPRPGSARRRRRQ